MTFFIQEQTTTTEGGTDTLKGLNDGLVVTLNRGAFVEYDTPTITSSVSYFSPVQEFPVPRTRMGVIAYYFQAAVAPSGSYIAVEWADSASRPWYPAPTSTTGDSRLAKTVAAGGAASDDRVLLTRAQPMNIFWRVEIRSGGADLTGGKLFINYGPVV